MACIRLMPLLFWACAPAEWVHADPLRRGVRDIELRKVEAVEGTSVSDLLRGYTGAELAAAEKALPRRDEPQLPKPILRTVTVKGRVYLDRNANGKLDEGETGLKGVSVSDGERVNRTGPEGEFSFSFKMVDEAHYRIIFATRPTGYRPTNSYFFRIPYDELKNKYTAHFGFIEDELSRRKEFWFISGSDSQFNHITSMIPIAKDYAQVTDTPGDPAFLVTVGDLTMNGTQYEKVNIFLAGFKSHIEHNGAPVALDEVGDWIAPRIVKTRYEGLRMLGAAAATT